MKKNYLFWLLSVILINFTLVTSQVIVPVVHPFSGDTVTTCNLSVKATDDYYNIRDFVYTFLEKAETDFRLISDDEKKLQCQYSKGNLSELIDQATKDWGNCLTDGYAYFSDIVRETLQNFLDFFCQNDEVHIAKYFYEDAKQCRLDITKPLFDNCLVKLYSNNRKKMDYTLSPNTFLIPEKRDSLCRILLNIGPCITETLHQHCSYQQDYQKLSIKLYEQTIKPCDGYRTYLHIGGIIGWTLFVISTSIALVVRFFPVRKWWSDYRQRSSSKTLVNNVF